MGPFWAPVALGVYALYQGFFGRIAGVYGAYLLFLAVFGFQIWLTVGIIRASRRSGFDGRGGRWVVVTGMVVVTAVTAIVLVVHRETGTIALIFCVPVQLSGALALWHLARRRHFG